MNTYRATFSTIKDGRRIVETHDVPGLSEYNVLPPVHMRRGITCDHKGPIWDLERAVKI